MSETTTAEEVQTDAPQADTPAPEATQAKPAEEAPAPAPAEEKPVKEETKSDGPDLSFFVKRIGELETQKKELAQTIAEMKDAEHQRQVEQMQKEQEQKNKARADLLQGEWGIVKEDYMRLAPTVEEADPTTDKGRDALRQWVNANPGLFNKAPELPQSEAKSTKPNGMFSGRAWTWADKFREQ